MDATTVETMCDFLHDNVLPKRRVGVRDAYLLELGFALGEPLDEQFIAGQVPDGWRKVEAGRLNWYFVYDHQGRPRAQVYVKRTWYDYRAKLEMLTRYSASVEPRGGWGSNEYAGGFPVGTEFFFHVWDAGARLHTSPPTHVTQSESAARVYERLIAASQAWLEERFPRYHDHEAYWDD